MVKKLGFTFFLLILWEVMAFLSDVLPSVMTIVLVFLKDFNHIMLSGLNSLLIIAIAMIIMIVMVIGMIYLSMYNWFKGLFEYLNTILHPIPGVALLIVVITLFGIGLKGVLAIMVHSMLWPTYNTMTMGLNRLNHDYGKIIKGFEIDRKKVLTQIYIKGLYPSIITSLRTAWSRGWRAFISAEMILGMTGNYSGIGRYLFEKRVFMNIPAQFAGLIMIIIISLFIEYIAFELIEKKTIKIWAI